MAKQSHFTNEQKMELLCNPYTAGVSDCQVTFSLEFKEFVIENIDKEGMTAAKIFELTGYSKDLFKPNRKRAIVASIRREAASPEGIKEPKVTKKKSTCKKRSETEFKELEERVSILEQQVNFLKKSQLLKRQKHSKSPTNSN